MNIRVEEEVFALTLQRGKTASNMVQINNSLDGTRWRQSTPRWKLKPVFSPVGYRQTDLRNLSG